ncbi:MAG: hypothetical protein FWF79_00655 [Defluviitaleaceae bacterium]|nr:hypothetical protein [Defluviitaleaceae bacterium]
MINKFHESTCGMSQIITTSENAKKLAFAYRQFNANKKAYDCKLITKDMYEFAKEEILKLIGVFTSRKN